MSAYRAVAAAPVAQRAPANPEMRQNTLAIARSKIAAVHQKKSVSYGPPRCTFIAASAMSLNTYATLADTAAAEAESAIATAAAFQCGRVEKRKKCSGFLLEP